MIDLTPRAREMRSKDDRTPFLPLTSLPGPGVSRTVREKKADPDHVAAPQRLATVAFSRGACPDCGQAQVIPPDVKCIVCADCDRYVSKLKDRLATQPGPIKLRIRLARVDEWPGGRRTYHQCPECGHVYGTVEYLLHGEWEQSMCNPHGMCQECWILRGLRAQRNARCSL